MGDLNSHSNACWGSKQTDARGKAWESFICDKGLRVLNRGDRFTYLPAQGQTIIDVTLATPGVADLVMHWATVDYVPSSDHVLNEFMFLTDDSWTPRPPGYILDDCKVKWDKFSEYVDEAACQAPQDCWSLEDMNTESRAIISAIQKGLQLFAPPLWAGGQTLRC